MFKKAQSFGQAVDWGAEETWRSLTMVVRFLKKLGTQISVKALGGPITIAMVAGKRRKARPCQIAAVFNLLSANLAVLNLLPIPLLDGGHLIFLAYEGIRGKPADERVQIGLSILGFRVSDCLMLFVDWHGLLPIVFLIICLSNYEHGAQKGHCNYGIGVVSPIGIGQEAFWASLCEGRSGVRRLNIFDDPDLIPFGGEVSDFDPKTYIRQRKSLKVMSRDIQLAFAAADMACREAGHHERPIDPERLGVIFGDDMIPCELHEFVPAYRNCIVDGRFDFNRWGHAAMTEIFPLWMLKYLPNMPACHIGIAQDARGPNNTLTLGDVSSLSAAAEAVRVLERGAADAMIVGGAGSRIHPTMLFRGGLSSCRIAATIPRALPGRSTPRATAWSTARARRLSCSKPSEHAQARGTAVLARVLGCCGGIRTIGQRPDFAGHLHPPGHHRAHSATPALLRPKSVA